jgi:hypothetical protein
VGDEGLTLELGRLALKPAQEQALVELENGQRSELTRATYEELTGVSRSQAAYDLADLVTLGVLERVGSGRATRYRSGKGGGGRPRKWTEERIRSELALFCAETGRWPRASSFRESGRGDLYLAASRYGGIDYWTREFGYGKAEIADGLPVNRTARGRRVRGVFALAGVLAVFVVIVGGVQRVEGKADLRSRTAAQQVLAVRAGTSPAEAPSTQDGQDAPPALPAQKGRKAPTTVAQFRLLAANGSCWLAARRGSAEGKLLFEGILSPGHALRLRGERLWIRLGAPSNLRGWIGNRVLALPARTSTVMITSKGLRVLEQVPPPPVSSGQPIIVSTPSSAGPQSGEQLEPDPLPSPDPKPGG